MAKVNFKDLLLNKGDKALLGFGAVGLGLLFVWSVSAALGGPDSPSVTKSKLESEANRISGAVASNNEVAYDELPAWVTKKVDYATFDSQRFALASPPFEPTNEPSRLRDLPPVLTPVPYEKGGGVQVSLIRAPMPAWDVKVDATTGKVMIGILDSVKVKSMDQNSIRDFRRRGQSSRSAPAPRLQQPPVGIGGPGGPPGGGEGMPGGGPGGGRGGMPGGPGDMMGMGMGGSRAETVVRYVTPEEFDANRQYVQAVTVEPLRMLSVQMAFPLKQQFEEIRKALKLPTLTDAIAQSGYLNWQSGRGLFAGIEVRRMEITAAGDKFDWADLKHEEMYRDKIFRRKIADVEDDGYLSYFALPSYYQRLAVPYPLLADGLGSYDTITLNAITESIERLKTYKPKYERPKSAAEGGAADQNPFIPSYGGGQFGGAGGLFSGGGIGNMQGPGAGWAPGGPPAGMGRGGMGGPGMGGPGFGGAGGTGSPDGAGPGAGGPGFGGGRPGLPGAGGPGFGGPGAGGAGGTGSPDGAGPGGPGSLMGGAMGNPRDPKYYPLTEDFLLIRFLDTEIRPGNTYQYQIRVIMNNPNFGKQDVSQAEYGKKEKIEGPWWTIPGSFTIPQESYIYAITPKSYEEKVKEKYKTNSGMQELLIPRDGKTVVQIQSWSENVRLKDFNEPIGTWIVGEIPTGPGEFIGRKHLLQLPTWSAERAAYALKELPGGVKVKGSPPRDTPRGWIVDLSTAYVLVDFDGGKYRGQVGNNNVQDEADVELLILKPDGKLMIRNSAVDMAFENRKVRAENWENWIRKSEEQAMRMTTPAGAGPGGGFGRGGTGSPDGP